MQVKESSSVKIDLTSLLNKQNLLPVLSFSEGACCVGKYSESDSESKQEVTRVIYLVRIAKKEKKINIEKKKKKRKA